MSKQKPIEATGTVIEALGNSMFRVRLNNGHDIITYLSGKIKMHSILIIVGDGVTVEMSPYDLNRGRIVRRLSYKTS